ncbi:MAG TPA: DUF1326 domain-containing protein [Vicinamibacteria bacterium]|nr:DUF1326 domain-containing protein [Vicinamibacteria bacterium]
MSRRLTAFLSLTASAAVAAGVAAEERASVPPNAYAVRGHYYESCACTVSCPCASNLKPTEPHCDAAMLFHFDRGHVGATSLDGLSIVGVIRSPEGAVVNEAMEKGEMDLMTFYFDERATPQQREAIGKLMPALFGEAQPKGFKPPQFTPIKLDVQGDVARLDVGSGKLAFEIENLSTGPDTKLAAKGKAGAKKRVTLTNTAPFPFVADPTQGRSKVFDYDDLGTKWHYEGRNAFFSTFHATGTVK